MKIIVNPHNVKIIREESEPINELEVNISKCLFEFDERITEDFTKEAYFTLNGNTYKQTIIDNECDYPSEVLVQSGTLEVGVVAYKVVNGQELIRYNPTSDYFSTWEGSLKEADNTEPITPTDKEQMQSQITQNAANISNLQTNKQDKLTAGDNITIDENNVISAVDTIYDDTEIKADIQELQETKVDKDVNNLTYYTLTTETGSKITLSIDSSTYIMTLKLKDKNNNDISTANVDLPLETMVVGARYDSTTKEIVLTLKNGQEVRFSVADLVSGLQTEITENNKLSSDLVDDTNNTNKFVSASEKAQITTNKNDILAIKNGQNIDSFADVETALNLKEDKSNKVTEINSSSIDTQYPSAKCVYDSQEEQNEQIAELEMLYNAFPTVSAENETIQLDNTAKVKFREIDLKGNTSQVVIPEEQGTSVSNTSIYVSDVNTDKEHTIEMSGNTYQYTTTGKNKFKGTTEQGSFSTTTGDTLSSTTRLRSTEFSSTNESTQYTLSGSASSTLQAIVYEYTGGTYNQVISTSWTTLPYTFTTSTGTNQIRVVIRYSSNETIRPSDVSNIQLETGSTATDYEPYTNGASPNPSYPQNIEVVTETQNVEVCGKNLFDKNGDIMSNYRLNTSGGNYLEVGYYISPYIKVEPNTQYTKNSPIADAYHRVCFYSSNNDNTYISRSDDNTITTPSNCQYLRFCGLQTELDTAMLEKGSTATTYEQYQGNIYPINLGNIELCKINTYQDKIYKRNDKWYLEKNVDKIVFNGSENWVKGGTTYNNQFIITNPVNNVNISTLGQYNNNVVSSIFSNYFTPVGNMASNNGSIGISFCNFSPDTQIRLGYGISSNINTVELLKTWLSTHNTIVYYVLDTPTTTEITDTTLVNQLNALYNATIYSTTNINTDTSNLLPYIDLHYNFVTPSPSPSRPSNISVVKGNNTITISNSDDTESQVFPINIGDMELCKIGTYQDYIYESNGNWFKKGNIGKVVLDGDISESYNSLGGSGSNPYYVFYNNNTLVSNSIVGSTLYTNYFITDNTSGLLQKDGGCRIAEYNSVNRVFFCIHSITSVNDFKNWLSTHNTIIYYPLATPTDTQITDTTLITQLNNIKKAYSYDTQTNISQTNTDKPFIIYAEAIRSLKDVFE